jgi:hypothetical protein
MTAQPGILAIFHQCRAGREADFETWYQTEHLVERLGVPGFLFGRRYKGIAGTPGYFCFYLVECPDVLTSKPYLERLDNPTPMTRMMMSEVFTGMNRTICARVSRRGRFRGAFAAIARFNQKPDDGALSDALENSPATSRLQAAKSGSRSTPACRCRRKNSCAAATTGLRAR